MSIDIARLDRRRFLRGSAAALAVPMFETFSRSLPPSSRRRFACVYWPDGVPMPLAEDPAYKEWSWFPHGSGKDFEFTRCMEVLAPLRNEMTILSGLSHPAVRAVHGHSNADQFLTGADTGATGDYRNSISLDQEFAAHVGDQTRYASLVMSTDGGTGTPRGAHTLSFDQNGRAIPAAHRPQKIFDALFVKRAGDAKKRLDLDQSALDDLLEDARSLRARLSKQDQESLEEYLDSIRTTEKKIAKARRWLDQPLPKVEPDGLKLNLTADDSREYLQVMFDLMYLAFRTDSTRTATYQIGRENGVGISDHIGRSAGFPLAHQLSHDTKKPGGWKNFATYCGFLNEELGRFAAKLRATPEPGGGGNMLDRTVILYGSASSAFHLSRNYPLILLGGKRLGFTHGEYRNLIGGNAYGGAWDGGREPWQREFQHEDTPLAHLFVTILQRLGVETEVFAGIEGALPGV